ncbi:MAG: hypothetical protein ACKVHO_15645 [Verrucomicrobiia bacterium]|jgi:hypothetical protein
MSRICFLFIGAIMFVGCVTSTVEKRRTERWGAYSGLTAAHKSLVDQGEIEAGMTEDAVYIAWGEASQVLRSGDRKGNVTTWLYEETTNDTHYRWRTYQLTRDDGTRYLDRRMVPITEFRDYVSAKLVFKDGALERWEMLPRPAHRSTVGGGGGRYR